MTVGSLAITATGAPETVPSPVTTPSAPSPSSSRPRQQSLLGERVRDRAAGPPGRARAACPVRPSLLAVVRGAPRHGALDRGSRAARPAIPQSRRSPTRPARRAARGSPAAGPGRPAPRARPRAAGPGRSRWRSPISCSIDTRSSVAMLPVAPAGTGQPPSSPKLDSKLSIPASSAASTLASPWPRVLWKWAVSSTPGNRERAAAKNVPHLYRVGHPGGVAKPDLDRTGLGQSASNVQHAIHGHSTLIRAPERRRDHALAPKPLRQTPRERPLQAGNRLSHRPPDVLQIVRLGSGQEAVDLVKAVPERQRPIEAALVRDQHADRQPNPASPPPPAPPQRRPAAG